MIKIFPTSIIHQTTEYYQSKIDTRSRAIYLSFLGLLFLIIISLPFIHVDLSIQARGTFQSSLEKNEVLVPVSGKVKSIHFKENEKMSVGDKLVEFEAGQINFELDRYTERLMLLSNITSDLNELIRLQESDIMLPQDKKLKTNLYIAYYYEFHTQYRSQASALDKAFRDHKRNQLLYETGVIAFAEYDETKLKYEQAAASLKILYKKKISEWEQELVKYNNEYQELVNKSDILLNQKKQYQILAGVSGTIINTKNIKEGDFVFANQKIGEISPDSPLLAIAYISPKDIGFIKLSQPVYFQIDAYNYNDWGLAKGKVIEIADDLSMISDKQVAFRIICALEDDHLTLKNGYRGEIRKGMTFNARFLVTKRSLFQLLYDKVDNWLNPTVNTL
jgi:multidrug resistance efflux pump